MGLCWPYGHMHGRMSDADQIRKALRSAFPSGDMPPTLAFSDPVNGDIHLSLQERLGGKLWPEVGLNDWIDIASPRSIALIVSADTFHYYVPSLLAATIDQAEYRSWGIEALMPLNDKREARRAWELFRTLFNPEQTAVIRKYLTYILSTSAPDSAESMLSKDALDRFWT